MNNTTNLTGTHFRYPPNYTPDIILATMIILAILAVIGALGNTMVIYYVSRKSMKLSSSLILTLAMSDGLYCVSR